MLYIYVGAMPHEYDTEIYYLCAFFNLPHNNTFISLLKLSISPLL
jgi:hypothetical protein